MTNFPELTQAVIDGDGSKVMELVSTHLETGSNAQTILSKYLIPGMLEVGALMESGEYFIPEVLRSAKAMNGALDVLEPLLLTGEKQTQGFVILGTVEGDVHDIGKNLVGMMLKGSGFEVLDIGTSVPKDKFLDTLRNANGTVLLGMSALITPVLDEMSAVIKGIEDAGLRERVKIMVGGAPVNQEFADSIGADGTAADAAGAVRLAKKLLEL